MRASHALTLSGRTSFEFSDAVKPVRDQLARALSRLDGTERYSLVLWRLPAGVVLNDVDLTREPRQYLQCAGSAERMTIEVRQLVDGTPVQSVLGHASADGDAADETVVWNGYTAHVRRSEIFDATEAIEIFGYYLDHDDVSPAYERRPLALS